MRESFRDARLEEAMNEPAQIPALLPALPELVLAVGAMALLMYGVYARRDTTVPIVNGLSVVLLIVAGLLVLWLPAEKITTFGGSFIVDRFARIMKVLALIGSATAIAMSVSYFGAEKRERFEFPILILLSTLGMMLLASAGDLIALYLGLELMSLSLYVLAAIDRDSERAAEAGLKYFVLGALSSGMLLYGASLIYGVTGTVAFSGIAQAASQGGVGLVFGIVFLFAGFCFKISAVPFHMWTPDVYEGAPTPITAFFAAAPKVAAIAMFVRATIASFPGITTQWQQILVFVAIASMALGAFAAIAQRNIKRLMAYSSIGHMGFALIGLAAATEEGVRGVVVYMAIYLTMTLGTFACILAMRRDGTMVEEISDLAGLARTNPAMAFFLAMLLFSLAGVPPLAGFFAKFYVFLAAIKAGLYTLAVIGVLASVVGAYYYLMIIKIMYFDEPKPGFAPMPAELKTVLAVTGLFNLLFFAYPAPLLNAATAAAKSLF
jgi:NADH-quinone oxidoreductase subunit N